MHLFILTVGTFIFFQKMDFIIYVCLSSIRMFGNFYAQLLCNLVLSLALDFLNYVFLYIYLLDIKLIIEFPSSLLFIYHFFFLHYIIHLGFIWSCWVSLFPPILFLFIFLFYNIFFCLKRKSTIIPIYFTHF